MTEGRCTDQPWCEAQRLGRPGPHAMADAKRFSVDDLPEPPPLAKRSRKKKPLAVPHAHRWAEEIESGEVVCSDCGLLRGIP